MEIPPVFYLIWIRQKNKKYLMADVTSEQVLNASFYASIQDAATTGTDAIRYFLFFVRQLFKSGLIKQSDGVFFTVCYPQLIWFAVGDENINIC